MPPQLLALAIAGAGLYAGYRLATRMLKTLRAEPTNKAQDAAADEPRDLGRLEWDEVAQVYRPRRG